MARQISAIHLQSRKIVRRTVYIINIQYKFTEIQMGSGCTVIYEEGLPNIYEENPIPSKFPNIYS
jgi:hypothetical protein